jgi:hypothetical protein
VQRDHGKAPSLPACRSCGFVPEQLVLRCPRCLTPLAFGCDGDCRSCAKKKGC